MVRKQITRFCLVVTVSFLSLPAMAQDGATPPAGTTPPTGQHAVLMVKGDGVQIYSCKEVEGTAKWVFQAPEAKLLDGGGNVVGSHGAGPFWKSVDGSVVKGQVVASSKAPGAGDVAWLLLKASAHEGDGVLSKVEYIRRSETHGGVAPDGGCDALHLNASERVPYTATYAFYSSKD